MFNVVDKYNKLVKIILTLIIISFALWGIAGYLGMSSADGTVAKVGDSKIFLSDINQEMQNNPSIKNKNEALNNLISRQLLINLIADNHLTATKKELQKAIMAYPEFQENGAFSITKYKAFLRSHFINVNTFEGKIKDQILLNQILEMFKASYFNSAKYSAQLATSLSKERTVLSYKINHNDYINQINISPESIANYYKEHIANYTLPERVQLQYIKLTPETVAQQVVISPSEIDQYISQNESSLLNKQIDASHILFAVAQGASPSEVAKVKQLGQKVLAEVKANPQSFAKLAKQYSADKGSALNGGELGYFGRGVMVKPFESVAFSLAQGQISNLVRTRFGFHIIKLNKIKTTPMDQVKAKAVAALKIQNSTGLLQKNLDKLKDITYTQSKNLTAASKSLGIAIESSHSWILKGESSGAFGNPLIQKAIFNNDVIVNGNNSEVVDLGSNQYAVYRVTKHQASRVESLSEVSKLIETSLKLQMAAHITSAKGAADVKNLRTGKLKLSFSNKQVISLLEQNPNLNYATVQGIFSVPIESNTPAYIGGADKNGDFIIYKIIGETINPKLKLQNEASLKQMQNEEAMSEFGVYLNNLIKLYKITYHQDQLNTPIDQGDSNQDNG